MPPAGNGDAVPRHAPASFRSQPISTNFAFIAASNLLSPLFSLILVLAISRLQGVEALGKYSLLMTVFVFAMSVAGFGLQVVVTREVARAPGAAGPWFIHAAALSAGLWLPILAVAFAVGARSVGDREMGLALCVVGLAVLPSAVAQQAEAVLLAYERAQDFVLINLGETALRASLGTALVVSGVELVGIAVLMLVLRVGAALVFVVVLRRRGMRTRPRIDRHLFWRLARYIPVTGLIPVVNALYARGGMLVLSSLATWREVGLYSAALRLVDVARTVVPAYARAIYPVLAQVRARGDAMAYAAATRRAVRHSLLLAVPLALALCGTGEPSIRLLFGADLAPAAALLTGLAWLVVPFALAIVLAQVLFAADRQSVDLGVNLVSMAASIGGALLLVPHLQAVGAVVAALAAATLYAGLQYAGVVRWVTTPAAGGDLVRFGAATAGAVMVLWGTARAGSLASTAFALSTFLASCVATGLLSVRARLGRVMTPPGCRSIMRRPCPTPGRTMPPTASCATAPPCTSAPSVPATVTSSRGGSPS